MCSDGSMLQMNLQRDSEDEDYYEVLPDLPMRNPNRARPQTTPTSFTDEATAKKRLSQTMIPWKCTFCQYANPAMTDRCKSCNRHHLSAWHCNMCNKINHVDRDRALCSGCQQKWHCHRCTYQNDPRAHKCIMCTEWPDGQAI